MNHSLSRRGMLLALAQVSVSGVLAPVAARAAERCVDPSSLDAGQQGLRMSLNYVEQGPDPRKTCSACGFFQPGEQPACGTCTIFNGPANPQGHCDSWGAKP